MINDIIYDTGEQLNAAEFADLLKRSTLAARRPINEPERIEAMCRNANIVITARRDGKLVGVARSISDFAFCTYLSDLAVDEACQAKGIGRQLIKETIKKAPQAKLILLSAPAAVNYYPKIGMTRHDHCYFADSVEAIK